MNRKIFITGGPVLLALIYVNISRFKPTGHFDSLKRDSLKDLSIREHRNIKSCKATSGADSIARAFEDLRHGHPLSAIAGSTASV